MQPKPIISTIMITYTAIYEITPKEHLVSKKAFEKFLRPAKGIIRTLAASFGSPEPKVEIMKEETFTAHITVSISAGQQKHIAIYELFNIIGDYIAYRMAGTSVRALRSHT